MIKRSGRGRRGPDVSVLADVPPFDRYAHGSLAPLVPRADRLRVPAGAVVAREGSRARQVVFVVAGTLLADRDGQPFGALGAGSCVGGREVIEDRAHSCTLVAGDGLEALVLTAPAYRWAVQTLPGLMDDAVIDLRQADLRPPVASQPN
jgi:CRP-like cAMP-binding protein